MSLANSSFQVLHLLEGSGAHSGLFYKGLKLQKTKFYNIGPMQANFKAIYELKILIRDEYLFCWQGQV